MGHPAKQTTGSSREANDSPPRESEESLDIPTLILREWSINDQLLPMLARLAREDADCYAFSCYIWNIDLVRRLCRSLRKVRPQALIVWGGPEVSHQAGAAPAARPPGTGRSDPLW